MAITISGSGITSANIADGTIVNADVNDVAASKLTGALPAISGAALTSLIGGLTYPNGTTLGGLRIQTGQITTSSSASDGGSTYGTSTRYYSGQTITLSGFASTPMVFATMASDWHDVRVATSDNTSTQAVIHICCSRVGGIQSKPLNYIAIGEAS